MATEAASQSAGDRVRSSWAHRLFSFTGNIGFVFWLGLAYLVVLLAIAGIYVTAAPQQLKVPSSLGPVAIGVPWFGALGATLTSLGGVFDHRRDWDPDMRHWHFARPFIGASLGVVAVLVFQAGILAVNSQPRTTAGPGDLLYYLIAFLVGYREETFRELIKRLGDVVLGPGGSSPAPTIHEVDPDSGPVAGRTPVTISGAGFQGTTSVRFGPYQANFKVDSDTQIAATSPEGSAGPVRVTVTTKQGSATGVTFTYK